MNLQLQNLKPTKSDVSMASDSIVRLVDEGRENALDVAIWLKAMEELVKETREKLIQHTLSELDKYHDGKANVYDVKVERMEAGVKYDYSGDYVWREMKQIVDKANTALKNREDMLKRIPQGHQLVDENGEAMEGPVKTSTTSYKVTLSK